MGGEPPAPVSPAHKAGEIEAGEIEAGEIEAGEIEARSRPHAIDGGEIEPAGTLKAGETRPREIDGGEIEPGGTLNSRRPDQRGAALRLSPGLLGPVPRRVVRRLLHGVGAVCSIAPGHRRPRPVAGKAGRRDRSRPARTRHNGVGGRCKPGGRAG